MKYYHPLTTLFVLLISATSYGQSSGFIENFTLPNVVTGQQFSLKEYDDASTVVIIFTSLYCPYAQLYETRIDRLIQDFQDEETRFILINPTNPNQNQQDSMENMVAVAQDKQLSVPFLVDRQQRVARMLDASKTPEALVLARQDKSFKIVYRGAIDDNPQVVDDVRHQYLRDFLKVANAGQTYSLRSIPATGCMIKP